jgi:hypothetical protein
MDGGVEKERRKVCHVLAAGLATRQVFVGERCGSEVADLVGRRAAQLPGHHGQAGQTERSSSNRHASHF